MEKLLVISYIMQRAYGRWLFQRLLPSIFFITGLVIVSSILISVLCVSAAYIAYLSLLDNGLTHQAAALFITTSALLTLGVLAFSAQAYLRHIRQLPKALIQQAPITSSATALLHAFINGLLAEQTHK